MSSQPRNHGRRESDQRRPGPVRIETEPESGKVTAEVDAVTPRELHAHLGSVYRRIDEVGGDISDARVDFERRTGRIEKLGLALLIAVFSPKVGGPDLPHTVSAALAQFLGG